MVVVLLSSLFVMISYAGQWKVDEKGYWWQEDDGSYPVNTWRWIDGNQDGVSECYYFDGNGYMLSNATTSDGNQVNENGAWTVDGIVQTESVALDTNMNNNIGGIYTIDIEKTHVNNNSSLQMQFGSGIKYGYEMRLGEDGSASWYIGIGNGGEGTYLFFGSEGEITYTDYEENTLQKVKIQQMDGCIVMDYYGYMLYWTKK